MGEEVPDRWCSCSSSAAIAICRAASSPGWNLHRVHVHQEDAMDLRWIAEDVPYLHSQCHSCYLPEEAAPYFESNGGFSFRKCWWTDAPSDTKSPPYPLSQTQSPHGQLNWRGRWGTCLTGERTENLGGQRGKTSGRRFKNTACKDS